MVWSTTMVVEEFLAEAGEFLRAEPARNSVVLTVTENLRVKAACAPPAADPPQDGQPGLGCGPRPDRPLLGWWRPDAGPDLVAGAFLHTPEFPVFLTLVSTQAATELAAEPDRHLLIEWLDAFAREVGDPPGQDQALPPMSGSATAA
jgi:hypothetical protein